MADRIKCYLISFSREFKPDTGSEAVMVKAKAEGGKIVEGCKKTNCPWRGDLDREAIFEVVESGGAVEECFCVEPIKRETTITGARLGISGKLRAWTTDVGERRRMERFMFSRVWQSWFRFP